jgi:hypothetical protein
MVAQQSTHIRLPQRADAVEGREGSAGRPSRYSAVKDPRTVTQDPAEAERIGAVSVDKPVEISATDASGGKKLGVMRYILGISIVLAAVAGVVLWNIYALR